MAANDKTPGELMTRTGANDSNAGARSLQLNSGEAQRQRLLKRLQQGPATTIELCPGQYQGSDAEVAA